MSTKSEDLFSGRNEFKNSTLSEADLEKNPLNQFENWYKIAKDQEIREVNAMVVSSVSKEGIPSSRVVYLRDLNSKGFIFFTNYDSTKGKNYKQNEFAAINFFWPDLQKQINVVGKISLLTPLESDNYFDSRPRGSQIGAWASNQSSVIPNREFLEKQVVHFEDKFRGKEVPRPKHWGGYCIKPFEIEFWQGRESRLHDRLKYTLEAGVWKITRLSP